MSTARFVIALCALGLCAFSPRDVGAQSNSQHARAGNAAHATAAAPHAGDHGPAASHGNGPAPGASSTATAAEGTVNINTASEEELERLPGIGPARAAAIVALRQRVQRFRSPDDLVRVRGIGRAAMRHLRPFVTLTGETTLASRPGRAAHAARATDAGEGTEAHSTDGGPQTQ